MKFTSGNPRPHLSLLCIIAFASLVGCSDSDNPGQSSSDAGASNALDDAGSVAPPDAAYGESSTTPREPTDELTLTSPPNPTSDNDAGSPSSTSSEASDTSTPNESRPSSDSTSTDTTATSASSESPTTNESGTSDEQTTDDDTDVTSTTSDSSSTSPSSSGALSFPDASDETTTDAGVDSGAQSVNIEDAGPPAEAGVVDMYTDLVLLLKMNEESFAQSNRVWDSSGLGNHGVPEGTVVPTTEGRIGGGAAFDGEGWISIPDAPSLTATTGLTIAAWVQLSQRAPSDAPGIVARRRAYGAESAYTLFLWEGNRAFVDVESENDRFPSNRVFELNTWYHLLVVFDGTLPESERVRFYVNGELDTVASETSASLSPITTAIEVGRLVNGGQTWIGTIDEVAIWTRALSTEEAAGLPSLDL